MLRLTGCCFLLFCNPALSISAEQKPLPFYSQVQSGVVRLEHYEVIQKEGQGEPSRRTVPDGTGFFVHDVQHCYIVTAGHVARQDYDLHGAVPLNQTATGKVEVWDLILPRSHWLFHREKGSATTHPVDVAVMKIAETPGWEKRLLSQKCKGGGWSRSAFPSMNSGPSALQRSSALLRNSACLCRRSIAGRAALLARQRCPASRWRVVLGIPTPTVGLLPVPSFLASLRDALVWPVPVPGVPLGKGGLALPPG